jgi:hypothetical protein
MHFHAILKLTSCTRRLSNPHMLCIATAPPPLGGGRGGGGKIKSLQAWIGGKGICPGIWHASAARAHKCGSLRRCAPLGLSKRSLPFLRMLPGVGGGAAFRRSQHMPGTLKSTLPITFPTPLRAPAPAHLRHRTSSPSALLPAGATLAPVVHQPCRQTPGKQMHTYLPRTDLENTHVTARHRSNRSCQRECSEHAALLGSEGTSAAVGQPWAGVQAGIGRPSGPFFAITCDDRIECAGFLLLPPRLPGLSF